MTTKQAIQALGWPYNPASLRTLKRYSRKGLIKAHQLPGGNWDYNGESIKALKTRLDKVPKHYLVGEVADLLRCSSFTVLKLRKQGKLTAIRHPGSGYWCFPKMKVLGEIESLRKN